MNTTALLFKLEGPLVEATVVKRPSVFIKTPYVADIRLHSAAVDPTKDNDLSQTQLAHSASLGCCGLADAGAHVLITPMVIQKKKDPEKLHCEYRICLSVIKEKNTEIVVGIHPKLAEELAESALKQNYLYILQNVKSYKRETCVYIEGKTHSRFDFSGTDSAGVPFLMEVKNVPLADYEDIEAKERKKKCYDHYDVHSKIAYFPDGFRKKKSDPVSPRALKHIKELAWIKKESNSPIRCIMCYVIQRSDVNRFQPSIVDPEYRNAVKVAIESGVEIITMVVHWTKMGEAYFVTDHLPITDFGY